METRDSYKRDYQYYLTACDAPRPKGIVICHAKRNRTEWMICGIVLVADTISTYLKSCFIRGHKKLNIGKVTSAHALCVTRSMPGSLLYTQLINCNSSHQSMGLSDTLNRRYKIWSSRVIFTIHAKLIYLLTVCIIVVFSLKVKEYKKKRKYVMFIKWRQMG